jgi:hypothetical protein
VAVPLNPLSERVSSFSGVPWHNGWHNRPAIRPRAWARVLAVIRCTRCGIEAPVEPDDVTGPSSGGDPSLVVVPLPDGWIGCPDTGDGIQDWARDPGRTLPARRLYRSNERTTQAKSRSRRASKAPSPTHPAVAAR